MLRSAIGLAAMGLLVVGLMGERVRAVQPVDTIEWVGGASGEWNNANAWRNVRTGVVGNATTLMGVSYGSEGMNSVDPTVTAARHIVIGDGAIVDYNSFIANAGAPRGIRLRQGTTLTIEDGAIWVQDISDNPSGGWQECRCDPSALILDGGTFRRTGEAPNGTGGGNALFGSYNDDNNQARLGTKPPTTNIVITNGGRLENTGQLWFGTEGESSPRQRQTVTINNGHMDLTGGDTAPIENSDEFIPVVGDLLFFYDNINYVHPDGPDGPLMEEHEINFTGPGSITVDEAGIYVYRQDEFGIWNTGAPQSSYQDLWDQGILKANGLSGQTGDLPNGGGGITARQPANFSDFFTVTGTPGMENYKITSNVVPIDTVEWVGGASGEWNNANAWRNTRTNTTGDANTIMGQRNGSDGMNTTDPATTRARNIVIGGGAMVEFNSQAIASDFRLNQGSTLTVKEGATWMQTTDATYTENRWTRFDPSRLTLDGGTFKRTGVSAGGDGGGILMMSSFSDDNNMARVGPPRINVEIKNGGRLENNGQVWFGADDEHSPDTRISWTINDGTVDLTGGTIPLSNSTLEVAADLALFYDYSENLGRPKNEEYEINFTGPGSITVDSAGIWVYEQDEFSVWNIADAGPLSYQDLWDMGILKANGLSGKMGVTWGDNENTPITLQPANFSTFFSVTGMPGMDNYILTSLIEPSVPPGLDGDFNNDGKVDAADYVVWRKTDGSQEGYNEWRTNFGRTSGSGSALGSAAVPEPSALVLLAAAVAAFGCMRRR
jgi:hypothetical protein